MTQQAINILEDTYNIIWNDSRGNHLRGFVLYKEHAKKDIDQLLNWFNKLLKGDLNLEEMDHLTYLINNKLEDLDYNYPVFAEEEREGADYYNWVREIMLNMGTAIKELY